MKYKTWCLIGLLAAFSFIVLLKGCDRDHSGDRIAAPEGTQVQKVVLRIAQAPRPAAKALRLKLEAVGIDDQDAAIGPVIDPVIVNNPVFPCSLNLTLFKPPCRYRLTISADLSRDPARSWQDVINICEPQAGGITIDVFENFLVGDLSITAPEAVNAGDPVDVSCTARQIDAPDRDLYPLTLSLREQGGRTISSSAPKEAASVADTFADPFAMTSPETQRLFTCTLADGRSASQVVQKTVARILLTPTPTPTSMPILIPTPLPTSTPTKTPVVPRPTATPTPTQVEVSNNSSGVAPNCGIPPYDDCQSIQDGIDVAAARGLALVLVKNTGADYNPGATITVNVTGLTIEAQSGVKINSTAALSIFYVTSDNVTITGFGQMNTTAASTMVTISGNNVVLEDNTIGALAASRVVNITGSNATLSGNTILGGGGTAPEHLRINGGTVSLNNNIFAGAGGNPSIWCSAGGAIAGTDGSNTTDGDITTCGSYSCTNPCGNF